MSEAARTAEAASRHQASILSPRVSWKQQPLGTKGSTATHLLPPPIPFAAGGRPSFSPADMGAGNMDGARGYFQDENSRLLDEISAMRREIEALKAQQSSSMALAEKQVRKRVHLRCG